MKTLRPPRLSKGFTLIELMVAISIMILLLLMIFSMVDQAQRTWVRASNMANQFKDARIAFETITRRVREATLNTYYDYEFNSNGFPDDYIRQSELHFICGKTADIGGVPETRFPFHSVFFQAPFGYTNEEELTNFTQMLNAWGFYIEFGSDREFMPPFLRTRIKDRYRYRLVEFRVPAEELTIFEDADNRRTRQSAEDNNWFTDSLSNTGIAGKRIVADNIIALIIQPMDSSANAQAGEPTDIAPQFKYNSRDGVGATGFAASLTAKRLHLLPPVLKITMVAMDNRSAERIHRGGQAPNLVPAGLFNSSKNVDRDIRQLEDFLNEQNVNYRVFATKVPLRASKWAEST